MGQVGGDWSLALHINPDSLIWYRIEQLISWIVEKFSCWFMSLNWSTAPWNTIMDCQDLYAELTVNHLVTSKHSFFFDRPFSSASFSDIWSDDRLSVFISRCTCCFLSSITLWVFLNYLTYSILWPWHNQDWNDMTGYKMRNTFDMYCLWTCFKLRVRRSRSIFKVTFQ